MALNQLAMMTTFDTSETERSLLGYLYSMQPTMEKLVAYVDLLDSSEFSDERCRIIFQAVEHAVEEQINPNLSGLQWYLKQVANGNVVKATDLSDLLALSDTVSHHHALKSIQRIKEASQKRRLVGYLYDQFESTQKDRRSTQEILGEIEIGLLEIEQGSKVSGDTDAKTIGDEAVKTAIDNAKNGEMGIPTGFSIDKLVGGLMKGHTWVIGGFSGTGKTYFALQLALNILRAGRKVTFFSLEMDRFELYYRLGGLISGKTALQLQSGKYQSELQKAYAELSTYEKSLHLIDDIYDINALRLRAKKMKVVDGVDVIFIDFIQNLQGNGQSMFELMTYASVELQKLAKELRITIVLLSQISNDQASSKSDVLAFKGSGAITQVCDVGIMLERDEDDSRGNVINLKIRKSRHGVSNRMTQFIFDFTQGGRFKEI